MRLCHFITHAEVVIDPEIPVPDWTLSREGIRRHTAFNTTPAAATVTAVYSSAERKARDAADILADHLGRSARIIPALHENDRTSTGYLPQQAFQRTADRFFAEPETSVDGWERAVDAQARIVDAVDGILRSDLSMGDIAILAHGGVGALLLSHLADRPISRDDDQPGAGGGNFFTFSVEVRHLVREWRPIEEA